MRMIYSSVLWVLGLSTVGLWLAGYGPGANACTAPAVKTASVLFAPEAVKVSEAPQIVAKLSLPLVTSERAPDLEIAGESEVSLNEEQLPLIPPTVQVYFAVGKDKVSAAGKEDLAKVVNYLKKHRGAVASVTGFHDPTGDPQRNKVLARNRALAVKAVIVGAGAEFAQVILTKPVVVLEGQDLAESRRVEVSVR